MMYNAGLVCVVKSNGKILREDKDVCFLPFNSEYSLLIKNLETRNVLVKISIDGQDVLDGNSLIIHPNNEIELEGFMKGNVSKNKFKFIKKTKEISDYRGDRIDDGIVRIEYQFEKEFVPIPQITRWYFNSNQYSDPYYTTSNPLNNILCSTTCNYNSVVSESQVQNDNGITVKGSEVNQSFTYGNIGCLEDNKRVIILRLIGIKDSGKIIEKPLIIQSKKICKTCGKKSKSHLKFCSNCGTFLE
jgi:hypothetical protein